MSLHPLIHYLHRLILSAPILPQIHDGWEPHYSVRVHPAGLNRWPHPTSHPLHALPMYLPGDCVWKSQHHHSDQNLSSAPSAHVLLTEPTGFCWHGPFIFCHTQYACKLLEEQKHNLLLWMCHSAWLSCFLWNIWCQLPSCHGIWPLCGNLSPTALFNKNVHASLCPVTGNGLCSWVS